MRYEEVAAVLEDFGGVEVHSDGSHHKWKVPGVPGTIRIIKENGGNVKRTYRRRMAESLIKHR